MRIGEVLVGQEYGAVDEPARRYSSITPRKVVVQEIVTVEEKVWGRYGGPQSVRKVRKVKVKLLDDAQRAARSWDTIAAAKKNSSLTVDARKLVELWSELEPGIKARAVAEQKRGAKESEIKNRLRALGFKQLGYGDVNVSVRSYRQSDEPHVEVEFNGKHVEKLLTMLEVGKGNQ